MALIKCPECGREISDKAESCPGCGYPIQSKTVDDRSDIDRLVDEIYAKNKGSRAYSIRELMSETGMDLKQAKCIIEKKHKSPEVIAESKRIREEHKETQRQNREDLKNSLNTLANLGKKDTTVRCPKCKSTSISYTNKKLSLGRTVVGGAVAGAPGAVIGGLSSKKGYAVCLNCGKQWKI